MADPFYPSVDAKAFEGFILASGKVDPNSKIKAGSTTTYLLVGIQPRFKRIRGYREYSPGLVDFNTATSWAIRLGFLTPLAEWLRENRNWHDGAYIV